jgi:predicted alpha/beta hydrolase
MQSAACPDAVGGLPVVATVMKSWRRFLTAKPFFFHVFGMAVEN